MIRREEVLNMIEGYGSNLQQWPVSNVQQLAEFITSDTELSLALSLAKSEEGFLKEGFSSTEPEWNPSAEASLADKINASVANTKKPQKLTPWWQAIVQRFTDPAQVLQAFPTVVAMLLLLIIIQVVYHDDTLKVDHLAYSTEELQDWLVFEGVNDDLERFVELDKNEAVENESTETELEGFAEVVYYL